MIYDLRSVMNSLLQPRFCQRLADFLQALNKSRLELSLEFVPVSHAVDVVRKSRVVNQLFPSYLPTQLSPGPVIAGANKNINVWIRKVSYGEILGCAFPVGREFHRKN